MPHTFLSPLWTISCRGVTVAAAAAGVTGLTRRRASQALETCSLRFDGRAFDAAPPLPFGATVTIARGETTWFVGRVVSVPSSGDDQTETQTCELAGPWWYLANLACQQPWTIRGGAATALLSRLVLGQAADGSALTTGQVIAATLQYAIDAGAPLAVGIIEPAFPAPLDEVKDLTCAEVIRRMLRWTPDCVAWFDHASAPVPTFHCRARANLPAATLTLGQPPLAAVRGLTARHDLLVPSVALHFETARQVDGQAQTDVVSDIAPAGATGREFGAVVGTIPLRGQAGIVLSQRIVTEPVGTDPAADGLTAQLIRRSEELAAYAADPDITADGITITRLARDGAGPSADGRSVDIGGSNGNGGDSGDDTALANALVEGQITDWMMSDCGVQAQPQRLTFAYTLDRGADGALDVGEPQEGSVEFMATSAASGVYTTLSSYRAEDVPPVGLAAAYLASLAALQYSGSLVLIEPEAGGTAAGAAGLGSVVNIAGAAAADWATMRAAVLAEAVDAAAGTTTLTLGPLPAADASAGADAEAGSAGGGLAALLRTTRGGASGSPAAAGTASSESRATGRWGKDEG